MRIETGTLPAARWYRTPQGAWVCKLEGLTISLLREAPNSWHWVAFADGFELGTYSGITRAKRDVRTLVLMSLAAEGQLAV